MTDEVVYISAARLKELQELEEKLPILIEEAVNSYKRGNLERLHARDKANPSAVNERVKRYAKKHREEINRKLREKRQLEKQRKLEESSTSIEVVRVIKTKKTSKIEEEPIETTPMATIKPTSDVLVRFDI
jgi:hypothetical protein